MLASLCAEMGVEMYIAKYIDHTLLKPDATRGQIVRLCEDAKQYGFASVCVNPYWVSECLAQLGSFQNSGIRICSVIGFPLGSNLSDTKALEAYKAFEQGADELDMVMNIGMLKSGDVVGVEADIKAVCHVKHGVTLKVIIETCLLTDDEKILACKIAKEAGADFVKTSTGFSTGGAKVEDVKLMRKTVGPKMGVKASGGINDYATAMAMINAGATRLGCSAGVAIVEGSSRKAGRANAAAIIKS